MIASALHTASWDENEALSLRDALSVIDAWDGDLGVLLEIDSDSSSSSDVSQPKKLKTNGSKTTYRHRSGARKQEIAALRAEARDLQYVVALGRALVGNTASRAQAAAIASEWERLAHTQQSRRVAAEMQNATLRRVMQSQVKYAKRMLELSRQVDYLAKELYVPELPSFVNYIGPNIDPEMHLREMDTLVSRATRVFSSRAFDSTDGLQVFHETKFRDDRPLEEGADLESQGVSMLPFDVRRVAEAMWLYTIRPTKNHKTSMDIYQNTNAVVSQFMGTSSFDDRFGVIQGQVAARMLPPDLGDGSILIVMHMVARTLRGTEVLGCVSSEGWVRMETVPGRAGPLTIVKRYRRMLMAPPANTTMSRSERCEWTQAVLDGPICSRFENEFATVTPAIESMLLSSPQALGITEATV